MNKSTQRDMVLKILRSTTSHPTAEWIYEQTKKEIPNISFATVYRNLNQLLENGYIIKVQGTFEKDRFDGNPNLHAHFICNMCGAVTDITVAPRDIDNVLAAMTNGKKDRVEISVFGTCSECIKKDIDNASC